MTHLTHEMARARRERIADLMRGAGGVVPLTRAQAQAAVDGPIQPVDPASEPVRAAPARGDDTAAPASATPAPKWGDGPEFDDILDYPGRKI